MLFSSTRICAMFITIINSTVIALNRSFLALVT